jgi:2'-5' RNA ligase
MDSAVEERALSVLVPEAEAFVRSFRAECEGLVDDDIPAHITINVPFVPDLNSESDLEEALDDLFSGIAAFPFALTEIRRFPNVLYLAPEPEERFRELITAVVNRFPESPPYEGQFDEVVPHLTVVYLEDSEALSAMSDTLAAAAEGVLPIMGKVTTIWLLEKVAGQWRKRKSFQLGGDLSSDS